MSLNELEFQTGYTSDPRFSADDEEDSAGEEDDVAPARQDAEDTEDDSRMPTATPSSSQRTSVTVEEFGLDDFKLGVTKRGVKLTSLQGPRRAPTAGASTDHQGIDLAVPQGTDVYAPLDGNVSEAGFDRGRGNYIVIKHNDALYTSYYHLQSAPTLSKGVAVVGGDLIGKSGSSGTSTGPHLHFEVYEEVVDTNKVDVLVKDKKDPLQWLKDNQEAIFPVAVTY